ncbi:MAG TPA: methylated-DNA--[protein]-cysteine S-methyltransferase [Rhizomicrobium sp.]|nr:methylated-DNA--[protein]-cysteine S-methyltransferase [Rhizomicrobium sp.]
MTNVLSFDENDTNWRRIARAIQFLSAHYQDQPTLEDAASAAGLSPHHFQRVFTRYVGVSPKSFVGHLTLEHAKDDLAAGTSVLDASLDAGLSGPSRLHDLALKIEAMTPGDYARGGEGVTITYGFCPSPFGIALIMTTEAGLCGLAFGDEGEERLMLKDMKGRWPDATYVEDKERTSEFARMIFGEGESELKLHLMGSPFQVKVWQALMAIPDGKTSTYHAVAKLIGNDKASRAVGAAVGRNPISWLIPCHRVLASDGTLNGYHWGLNRKRAMLAVEAARAGQATPRTSAIA